jgi:hypothetical protein
MAIRNVPVRTKWTDENGILTRTAIIFLENIDATTTSGGGGTPGTSNGRYLVPIVAGTATPDPSQGDLQKIVVVAALTIAAPIGTPADGDRLTLWIIQDSLLGEFQPVWDPIYKLGDYSKIAIDKGTFTTLDLFFDTANWYIAGYPVMGQTF